MADLRERSFNIRLASLHSLPADIGRSMNSDTRADIVVRPPLHPTLMWIPTTCFVGTLLTDIVYYRTAEMMWTDFSAWLISAGVILGWLSCIAGIVDLVGRRYGTAPVPAWTYPVGILVVM